MPIIAISCLYMAYSVLKVNVQVTNQNKLPKKGSIGLNKSINTHINKIQNTNIKWKHTAKKMECVCTLNS